MRESSRGNNFVLRMLIIKCHKNSYHKYSNVSKAHPQEQLFLNNKKTQIDSRTLGMQMLRKKKLYFYSRKALPTLFDYTFRPYYLLIYFAHVLKNSKYMFMFKVCHMVIRAKTTIILESLVAVISFLCFQCLLFDVRD